MEKKRRSTTGHLRTVVGTRKAALSFLAVSLVVTVLIGAGLAHLTLKSGMPLPSFENGAVTLPSTGAAPLGVPVGSFARILLFIILAALLLFVIIKLFRGVPWRDVLRALWSLVWKALLVAAVLALVVAILPMSSGVAAAQPVPPPRPLITAPLGPVPVALIWVVAIGLVSAVLLLGARMFAAKRRPASAPWALQVEKARQSLLAGGLLGEVIIECYQRMADALREEQDIEREAFMTTREFEALLAAKGVPPDPVHELTRLFEAVRYGHGQLGQEEKHRALQCLDSILEYSHQQRAGG
jgi:hypothetical protein